MVGRRLPSLDPRDAERAELASGADGGQRRGAEALRAMVQQQASSLNQGLIASHIPRNLSANSTRTKKRDSATKPGAQ
jgi:hypothetical protein